MESACEKYRRKKRESKEMQCSETEKKRILDILEREIEYALGCTEPGAVALAAAKARETLGEDAETLTVRVSGNVLKNAMNVGIPGTDLKGIEIAAALGCVAGKSEYGLEVLKDAGPEEVERARAMIREGRVNIALSDSPQKLYIEAVCRKGEKNAGVVIEKYHTNITSVCRGEEMLFARAADTAERETTDEAKLSMKQIWRFVQDTDCTRIPVLKKVEEINDRIVREGLRTEYGMGVGKHLYERMKKSGVMEFQTYIAACAAAAADARMAGCPLPVMATTGSGNQGITASVPVLAAAEWMKCSEDQKYRALALSELVTIHVKEYIGRLSALCGCAIAASIGSACGLTFLLGGEYENLECAVKNMIADISGLICDGAKAGCALKIATSVSGAVQCAFLAVEGVQVPEHDGIVRPDVEDTIRNLGSLGRDGMEKTDHVILDMMLAGR